MIQMSYVPSPSTHVGYRPSKPFPFGPGTTNPLYGPVPNPTFGFSTFPSFEPERYTSPRTTSQPLTNASVMSLRQQMDESNHEMVNLLTQQMSTVFNPLIQNTNDSYQMLAHQMGRIADFFGTPQPPLVQPRIQYPIQQLIMPAMSATPQNQGKQFLAQEQPAQQRQAYVAYEEPQYQAEINQPPSDNG
jgi:hypothetical protein